jgi:hypothetical protein
LDLHTKPENILETLFPLTVKGHGKVNCESPKDYPAGVTSESEIRQKPGGSISEVAEAELQINTAESATGIPWASQSLSSYSSIADPLTSRQS